MYGARAATVGAIALAIGATACGRLGFDGGAATDANGSASTDAGSDGAANAIPPDYTDGTRLRANRATDAAGVGALIDWYDTLLDEHCVFGTAADGALRCLPYRVVTRTFADAACATPLGTVFAPDDNPACGLAVHYALDTDVTSTTAPNAFALGSAWTGAVYGGTPASCGPSDYVAASETIVGSAPPSTFVAVHEQVVPHGRLQHDPASRRRWRVAADEQLRRHPARRALRPARAHAGRHRDLSADRRVVRAVARVRGRRMHRAGRRLHRHADDTARRGADGVVVRRRPARIHALGAATTGPLFAPSSAGSRGVRACRAGNSRSRPRASSRSRSTTRSRSTSMRAAIACARRTGATPTERSRPTSCGTRHAAAAACRSSTPPPMTSRAGRRGTTRRSRSSRT